MKRLADFDLLNDDEREAIWASLHADKAYAEKARERRPCGDCPACIHGYVGACNGRSVFGDGPLPPTSADKPGGMLKWCMSKDGEGRNHSPSPSLATLAIRRSVRAEALEARVAELEECLHAYEEPDPT